MKGDAKAIEHLNIILGNELVAVNQYMLHSKMHKHWGFQKLAAKLRIQSIDEMKHTDLLSDRILELDGLPNFQKLGKLKIGQNVKESFECDRDLEAEAIPALQKAIVYLESCQDFYSRSILTTILADETQHLEWISTQLELMDKLGLDNYLSNQL